MSNSSIGNLTDKLGTARLAGVFANQSPEWHAQRATGIGGSDVGTIVGCNPWQSAYHLAAVRLGKIENNFEPNEAMEWGTRLEPVILDKFAENHPEFIVHREVGSWTHQDREWQLANPDAIFEYYAEDPRKGEDQDVRAYGIVEVKTAEYEDAWSEGVPAYYRTQVQWYLQTFGFQRAIVVALFRGKRYREYEVLADEFEQETNLASVIEFKKLLDAGELPDFSAPMISTYNATRELHPEITDDEVELADLGVHYFLAVAEHDKSEEHLNEMRARILDAMGTAKRGLVNGEWLLTRQARNGGTPYLVAKRK